MEQVLGATATKMLKFFHIIFVALWFGAGVSIMVVFMFAERIAGESGLQIALTASAIISDYLILPMLIGTVTTGMLYSILTSWGFFTHHWITVKWILTTILFVLIVFNLYPENPVASAIIYNLQLAAFFFIFYISIFKPWGQSKHKLNEKTVLSNGKSGLRQVKGGKKGQKSRA